MNREAAALGVPVYSIFRGKIGAVDRYLAEHGRLTLVESVADVRSKIKVVRWNRPSQPQAGNRQALQYIVKSIMSVLQLEPQNAYLQSPKSPSAEREIAAQQPEYCNPSVPVS